VEHPTVCAHSRQCVCERSPFFPPLEHWARLAQLSLPVIPHSFSFDKREIRSMVEGEAPLMSDVFRPYERLVEITILGKTFLVPERNSLLRAFQFISPETIPYGRFCWNQECQYCRVNCQLSDDDQARPILSCKFIVSEGMNISELAPELVGCLRTKLGQTQVVTANVPADVNAPDTTIGSAESNGSNGSGGTNGSGGIHDHDE
jgi:hypothetical protein